MAIFLFSIPKSTKGKILHLRSKKKKLNFWPVLLDALRHKCPIDSVINSGIIKIWNCPTQYTGLVNSTLHVLQFWTVELIIIVGRSRIFIPYSDCGICKYKQNFHKNKQFRSKSSYLPVRTKARYFHTFSVNYSYYLQLRYQIFSHFYRFV